MVKADKCSCGLCASCSTNHSNTYLQHITTGCSTVHELVIFRYLDAVDNPFQLTQITVGRDNLTGGWVELPHAKGFTVWVWVCVCVWGGGALELELVACTLEVSVYFYVHRETFYLKLCHRH